MNMPIAAILACRMSPRMLYLFHTYADDDEGKPATQQSSEKSHSLLQFYVPWEYHRSDHKHDCVQLTPIFFFFFSFRFFSCLCLILLFTSELYRLRIAAIATTAWPVLYTARPQWQKSH